MAHADVDVRKDQEEYEEQQIGNRLDIRIIREMIYDKSIPKNLQERLWGITSKSQVLSNIEKVDERIQLRMFNITVREILSSMCTSDITSDFRTDLRNLEAIYRANLTRAKGPDRERVLQQKQVNENINTNPRERGHEGSKGFWGSTFGRMFGRKQLGEQT